MRILITGAAGGIGSTLGCYLNSKGHDLTLVDNLNNGYLENLTVNNERFGEFNKIDILDTQLLVNLIRKKRIQIIIHLAAITALPECEKNPKLCFSVNVSGTASVLNAARNCGIKRVVFASTGAVYENNHYTESPFKEDLEVSPRLFYSLSKKLAEEICISYEKNYEMEIPILRFFNVFGPRQDIHRKSPPLINYLVREFEKGESPILHSDGNQARDYVHVDDVCKIIEICQYNPLAHNNIWNVSTKKLISVNRIVEIIKEALNSPIDASYREAAKLWDSYPELFQGAISLNKNIIEKETNKFALGDNQKAKDLLGWNPNENIEELIAKTALEIKKRG
tara:strand:+ start:8721 stop:9734 length:1014 start_codon:yes stop_codon:yes gene_type:complete